MSETVSLSLVRPYATEEELIAAEGWAIDKKGMVLVEQPRLASGTLVRFELLLEGGRRVLVAEGKVVGYAKPKGGRPGGIKVRFKRFNAAAKAFIDRVQAANAEPPAPEAAPEPEAAPAPEAALEPEAAPEAAPEPEAAAVRAPRTEDTIERSGIRHRVRGPVAPPENREELLERLRERARLAKARESEDRSA